MTDFLPHVANLLILASFSARSMLWLRALNILAGGFFIAYFAAQPVPVWSFIGWNILFTIINLWHIRRIILERRPPVFSAEEQQLLHLAFSSMDLSGYRKLLDAGRWEDGLPPEPLITSGTLPDRLWMIASGAIEVRHSETHRHPLGPGHFVGDACFFTEVPTTADVVVVEPVRCLTWSTSTLRRFVNEEGATGATLQQLLGQGLVKKLEAMQ